MTITITIDPAVEALGIQTIAKALNVTGTDAECRVHLANHLKSITAQLYVRGEKMIREAADNASGEAAAAAYITVG